MRRLSARRGTAPFVLGGLALIVACAGEPRPTEPTSGAPPKTTVPVADVVPAPRPAPATAPTATVERDARRLVATWLDAQNAGRFDDYAKLYAERFEGVKRIGLRARRYDRKGWLADRQRMFGKPMVVKADDVNVQTTAGGALVRFQQHWRSGTFEDAGPKELQLVSGASGLSIAREVMLASEVMRHDAMELALADFMPVVHTARSYVVLSREGDPAWGTGRPMLDSDPKSSIVAARMSVVSESVPAPIRAGLPPQVRGHHGSGEACSAKVGPLFLLRRVVPHFGTLEAWRTMPADAVAMDAWNEAAERTLLVAQLDGPCDTALWARAADRPAPAVFVRQDASPELVASVERAVRALPAYRNIEREYRATDVSTAEGAPPRWEHVDQTSPKIWLWRGEHRTFVSYDTSVGGCGSFGGDLWVVFERRGDKLVPVNAPAAEDLPSAFGVAALFDADGDGALELLGRGFANPEHEADVLLHGVGGRLVFMNDLSPPFHDCGC